MVTRCRVIAPCASLSGTALPRFDKPFKKSKFQEFDQSEPGRGSGTEKSANLQVQIKDSLPNLSFGPAVAEWL